MSPTATRTGKKNNKAIPHDEPGTDTAGTAEHDEPAIDLKNYLDNLDNEIEYNVRLYRRLQRKGRYKSVFIDEYNDELPTYTEVGEKFGGGDYEFIIRIYSGGEKPDIKSNKFSLDDRFDEMIKPAAVPAVSSVVAPAPSPQNTDDSFNNTIALVEKVISLIAPMMKQQAPAAPVNPFEGMAAVTAMANKMIENSFNTQMKSQTEYFKQLKEKQEEIIDMAGNVATETEPTESDTIQKGIELVKQFLPMINTLGLGQLKPIAAPLKENPQVKYILDDQKRTGAFIKALEKTFPKKTAEKVVKVFIDSLKQKPETGS